MRPLEAYESLMAFASERGEEALHLALHASVPQSFRPDFLHLLRLNFLPDLSPATEADVLLAPFCEDTGGGYYQFDSEVRRLLLSHLDPTYPEEKGDRLHRVANLLVSYIRHQGQSLSAEQDRLSEEYLSIQSWVALAFLDTQRAAMQLAAALEQGLGENETAARVQFSGLSGALSVPLIQYPKLLTYAAGLEALEQGRFGDAAELLERLPDEEIRIGGVTLRSPQQMVWINEQRELAAQDSQRSREPRALPPPGNWQDFEDLCFDLWSRIWGDPAAQKLGRSGQPEEGVDLLGRPDRGPAWTGVQCKSKGESTHLTRAEIEKAVQQARQFRPNLSRFIIATTARRDVTSQLVARNITVAQRQEGSFPVEVVAWEDILQQLAAFPEVFRRYYPHLESTRSETSHPVMQGYTPAENSPLRLGIRSFSNAGGREDEAHAKILDLGDLFDLGRSIKDVTSWQSGVVPRLRDFLVPNASLQIPIKLDITTHASIAFAAGYFLEAKSGLDITLIQRSRSGVVEWRSDAERPATQSPLLKYENLARSVTAGDIAVALSITRPILDDVLAYLSASSIAVRHILSVTLLPEPSLVGVRDGSHALQLARALAFQLNRRTVHKWRALLHLFVAAPNALLFFLGQRSHGLGRLRLYEFDFGAGLYTPSVLLPPSQ